ncbi:MAG: hypothetical protein WCK51_15535 [Armatimonadota bacterium]
MLNLALALTLVTLPNHAPLAKGTAASFPWLFANGNVTSRTMTSEASDEILTRAGYSALSQESATATWKQAGLPAPDPGVWPTSNSLRTFGRAAKVDCVLYGKVSWRTRSIWVNTGPKTISTATVTAYVYDVSKGRVVYTRSKVQARSDEKPSVNKIAEAILSSPLMTSKGDDSTSREQRAVQLALAIAYRDWVRTSTR